jgi:hypothetical protein
MEHAIFDRPAVGSIAGTIVEMKARQARDRVVAQRGPNRLGWFRSQGFGEGDFILGQGAGERRGRELLGVQAGEKIREAGARRIFAGDDAVARGAADRIRRIRRGEARAPGGEFVEVRRFIERPGKIAAEIAHAEIVGQEDQNVGTRQRGGRRLEGGDGQGEE